MKDPNHERISEYLFTFYSQKDQYTLLAELKKLIINDNEDYKLDIRFIERILENRRLKIEVDNLLKDISQNKLAYKIALIIQSLKSYFLFRNNPYIPLIEKREQLDIKLIEKIFEKDNLTDTQAQFYLGAILTVKNNISNNMI